MPTINQNSQKAKLKPIHLIIIAFIVIVFIFTIISLETIFHRNPFGDEIKIDNFSKYYKSTPQETRESIFASLFKTAELNNSEGKKIPNSGAIIRPDSAKSNYNESTDIHSGNFIVDLEFIQQSFKVYMEWSKNSDNPNLSGYSVTILCLTGQNSAYNSTKCTDMFTDNTDNKIAASYPIIYDLPIEISEYDKKYTSYTHYTITYTIENDNKISLIITDYTGGNYEPSLKKIRSLGFIPESYNITYIDQSSDEIPARPADYSF